MRAADAVDPWATTGWCAAAAVARRWARLRASPFAPEGGRRIMVIAPHPDDEALGCAGIILLHAHSGDPVWLACITDGAGSRAGGLSPAQMREVRENEARTAAKSLQVSRFDWLGLPEGSWNLEQMETRLAPLIREYSPQVIYAPSRIDFHPEHLRVAHGLAVVLSKEDSGLCNAEVRAYQLQVPLTPALTNLVADCSSVSAQSAAVWNVYESQAANIGRAVRMRRYTARLYGFRLHGEEFWQMPAPAYCRLHQSPPQGWNTARFRGLRYRSFGDPLAYFAGLQERRRLRRLLETGNV